MLSSDKANRNMFHKGHHTIYCYFSVTKFNDAYQKSEKQDAFEEQGSCDTLMEG